MALNSPSSLIRKKLNRVTQFNYTGRSLRTPMGAVSEGKSQTLVGG